MTGRVLVVGGTGCVGRHVCDAFAAAGAEVVVAARHPVADAPGTGFVPLDLTTAAADEVAGLLAELRIDTVVNAVLGWGADDAGMAVLNTRPTERLLAAQRLLPTPPRLVQLGTVHEYGPMRPGVPADEDSPAHPTIAYARAKLAATRLVVAAVRDDGADAVVLRLTNTVGPRPAPQSFFGALAGRLHAADAETGVEIRVVDARRDYVDVRDAAAAVVAAAASRRGDPVVNVGSGRAHSIRWMVDELVAAAGLPAGAVREPAGDGVAGQSGAASPEWMCLDVRRARRALGWAARIPLERSLREMYDSVGAPAGV